MSLEDKSLVNRLKDRTMRKNVKFHYTPKQVCEELVKERGTSKSPLKPKLYMQKVARNLPPDMMKVIDVKPFRRRDFKNAHYEDYINDFFDGKDHSNGLPWSKKLAQSIRYTNASLYQAIESSIIDPQSIHVSPTSGFHHAGPDSGGGFCTFSGQVIASMKMYRKYGVSGAYLDLDGHYGNSIRDSKRFIKDKYGKDLNDIIKMNINPEGSGSEYLKHFGKSLRILEGLIERDEVQYIVWCHGADSHEDDDLGHQVNTEQWRLVSEIFYTWLDKLERSIGRKIPLTLSLFGGYRRDDYQSVINLHVSDLLIGSSILCQVYFCTKHLEVKSKKEKIS